MILVTIQAWFLQKNSMGNYICFSFVSLDKLKLFFFPLQELESGEKRSWLLVTSSRQISVYTNVKPLINMEMARK
jgi:hypothetical protein